jgi:glutathione S-transferase
MTVDYTLYGGELSLYTGKARAYMRFKNLNWKEKIANRDVYKTIILPKIGAPIIPVLETAQGEYIQDTTDIIDFLEARHPEFSVYPETPLQRLVALMLEFYGDQWLTIPAMHYRWTKLDEQYDFVMSEFGRLSAPDATLDEQIVIGEKTSRPFRGSVFALGITEATIPEIESVYLEFLDQLNLHFADHDYLLGSRPSIGDFGFIGPLYAHLGRDPVPKALMQDRAPNVYAWVERMNAPQPLSGQFLPDDAIPDTLLPVLATLCRDQLPDTLDVLKHNSAFVESNPGEKIPRVLGIHSFQTGAATGERMINSFDQWMFQRSWLHYHSLQGADKIAADSLLDKIGGHEAMNVEIEHWLVRRAGQLELVEGARPN